MTMSSARRHNESSIVLNSSLGPRLSLFQRSYVKIVLKTVAGRAVLGAFSARRPAGILLLPWKWLSSVLMTLWTLCVCVSVSAKWKIKLPLFITANKECDCVLLKYVYLLARRCSSQASSCIISPPPASICFFSSSASSGGNVCPLFYILHAQNILVAINTAC